MNIVCIGAHPDDAECYAGGTLIKWADAGHRVLMVSLTNGDIGHFEMAGGALAERRRKEAKRSAEIGGMEECVLDIHDGELLPTLEVRREVVRIIRGYQADIVITHRPWDYHPDHRYASMAVQDAAFMVTVPFFCPDTPRLEHNPVFLYMMDRFTKPAPFLADVAVAVDDVMPKKWAMIAAMDSQFYEWLPWLEGVLDQVPSEPEARPAWLRHQWTPFLESFTEPNRDALRRWCGPQAETTRFAEYFEVCEYGRQLTPSELAALFDFARIGV